MFISLRRRRRKKYNSYVCFALLPLLFQNLWLGFDHQKLWLQGSNIRNIWFQKRNCDSKPKTLFQDRKIWFQIGKSGANNEIMISNHTFVIAKLKIKHFASISEIMLSKSEIPIPHFENQKFWFQTLKIRNSDSKSEIPIPNIENQKFWFKINNSDATLWKSFWF